MKDVNVVLTWPLRLGFITIHLGLKFGQEWIGMDVT